MSAENKLTPNGDTQLLEQKKLRHTHRHTFWQIHLIGKESNSEKN